MGEYIPALKRWKKTGDGSWIYSREGKFAEVRFYSFEYDPVEDDHVEVFSWSANDNGRTMEGIAKSLSKAVHNVEAFFRGDADTSSITFEHALDYLITVESLKWLDWVDKGELTDEELLFGSWRDLTYRCFDDIFEMVPFDLNEEFYSHGVTWLMLMDMGRRRAKAYTDAKEEFERTGKIYENLQGLREGI